MDCNISIVFTHQIREKLERTIDVRDRNRQQLLGEATEMEMVEEVKPHTMKRRRAERIGRTKSKEMSRMLIMATGSLWMSQLYNGTRAAWHKSRRAEVAGRAEAGEHEQTRRSVPGQPPYCQIIESLVKVRVRSGVDSQDRGVRVGVGVVRVESSRHLELLVAHLPKRS